MAKKLIMSWSKASISIAKSTEDGSMPAELTAIGVIKDKSTTLEASDGGELKAVASGGMTVASEASEGGFVVKTRVIEPDDALYTLLGLGTSATDEFKVKTHVVESPFALQVDPKNVGAKGIKAPLTKIKFRPGGSEEEGHYADLEFEIQPVLTDEYEVDHWYTRYTKKAAPGV